MRAQVPLVPPFSAPLQDRQSVVPPAQALAQQTPSTQKAVSHWAVDVHACPFVLRSEKSSAVAVTPDVVAPPATSTPPAAISVIENSARAATSGARLLQVLVAGS